MSKVSHLYAPLYAPFLPFLFLYLSPESSDSLFQKNVLCACVRHEVWWWCGPGGFFFPVHWVVHITGFGSFGRLCLSTFWSSYACAFTFSSRIMEVAFAYTLGFKIRFIPGLSLAFSRPPSLHPAAGSCCRCCFVVFFVQSSLFVSGVCNNECITLCFSPFSPWTSFLLSAFISRLFAVSYLPSSVRQFYLDLHALRLLHFLPHPIPLYLAFDDIFSYISSPDRCFPPSSFLLFLHS